MSSVAKPRAAVSRRPAAWALCLAFTLIYLAWGTTYLAIKVGVESFPPALFGGVRISLAGLVLLAYLRWKGAALWLPRRELFWAALIGAMLFVAGNGLITVAEKTVNSSEASVLVATTPLWMALIEMCWPGGERLKSPGWLGLLAGLGGVIVLLAPKLRDLAVLLENKGPFLVLASAFSWSVGSVVLRHRRRSATPLTTAAYQMLLGGGLLTLLGLLVGEAEQLTADSFTPAAVYSFFHLLVVGSLIGFLAYTWLLGHVSATLAGTYAYVNPMVAILVGWQLDGDPLSGWVIGGMVVILTGVALVRAGAAQPRLGKENDRSGLKEMSAAKRGTAEDVGL